MSHISYNAVKLEKILNNKNDNPKSELKRQHFTLTLY